MKKRMTVLSLAVVLTATIGCVVLAQRQDTKDDAQNDFLAKRTSASMIGSFKGFASLLYAAQNVVIHTESPEIRSAQLQSLMPEFYKPTWRELFDAIARKTQSEWRYHSKNNYWEFYKPQKPKTHYTLEIAQGWKPDNRGDYICYQPTIAPVGMDIYIMGTYSSDNPEGANELSKKVKDSFAIMFAKHFKDDVTPADMKDVTVNNYRALHFEIKSEKGIIWRQWVIVEAGKAFVIVSAIKPEHDAQLYPDVQKMIGSFTISK